MKIKISMLLLLSSFIFLSCNDNENNINSNEQLGCWVNPQSTDSVVVYQKTAELKDNAYGFAFNARGNFVERKITGWCATPPVSYSDYEGTWSLTGSIINITGTYWGGLVYSKWKIIYLDSNKLVFKIISQEYLEK